MEHERINRDDSVRDLTVEISTDEIKARPIMHRFAVEAAQIRPDELPVGQIGYPVFTVAITVGPADAEENECLVVQFDMDLEQMHSLALSSTDVLAVVLKNAVQRSLETLIAKELGE